MRWRNCAATPPQLESARNGEQAQASEGDTADQHEVERRQDPQDSTQVEAFEAEVLASIDLPSQQRRDQVAAEEEEDRDAETSGHELVETRVADEHQHERDGAHPVERRDVERRLHLGHVCGLHVTSPEQVRMRAGVRFPPEVERLRGAPHVIERRFVVELPFVLYLTYFAATLGPARLTFERTRRPHNNRSRSPSIGRRGQKRRTADRRVPGRARSELGPAAVPPSLPRRTTIGTRKYHWISIWVRRFSENSCSSSPTATAAVPSHTPCSRGPRLPGSCPPDVGPHRAHQHQEHHRSRGSGLDEHLDERCGAGIARASLAAPCRARCPSRDCPWPAAGHETSSRPASPVSSCRLDRIPSG